MTWQVLTIRQPKARTWWGRGLRHVANALSRCARKLRSVSR
jgi:hypothetical protein